LSEETTVPKVLSIDRLLDEVMNQIAEFLSGVFWNAPPRIVLDRDDRYENQFTEVRVALDRTDDGSFTCRAREAAHNLLSKIATDVNHPSPLAIGHNDHVLVFRHVALPSRRGADGHIVANGRIASRLLQISIAWFDGELVAEYKVDLFGKETSRIERCRVIR
jgi:hypothetical protein